MTAMHRNLLVGGAVIGAIWLAWIVLGDTGRGAIASKVLTSSGSADEATISQAVPAIGQPVWKRGERAPAEGCPQIPMAGPECGSGFAAQQFVGQYLGGLFTVADTPVIKGDRATVHAQILGQSCNLTLKRGGGTGYGWIVSEYACNVAGSRDHQ